MSIDTWQRITQLQVATQVMSGQGGAAKTYYARLSKIAAADGVLEWTKSYSVGATPTLVFQERWAGFAVCTRN